MSILNNADNLKIGDAQVSKAFLNGVQVWPTVNDDVCLTPDCLWLTGAGFNIVRPISKVAGECYQYSDSWPGGDPVNFETFDYYNIQISWNGTNWEITGDSNDFAGIGVLGGTDQDDPTGTYTDGFFYTFTVTETDCCCRPKAVRVANYTQDSVTFDPIDLNWSISTNATSVNCGYFGGSYFTNGPSYGYLNLYYDEYNENTNPTGRNKWVLEGFDDGFFTQLGPYVGPSSYCNPSGTYGGFYTVYVPYVCLTGATSPLVANGNYLESSSATTYNGRTYYTNEVDSDYILFWDSTSAVWKLTDQGTLGGAAIFEGSVGDINDPAANTLDPVSPNTGTIAIADGLCS